MKNKVAIIGGGTYQPIYNHVGLCSFAKGGTARKLTQMFEDTRLEPHLFLSNMAAGKGEFAKFHTNDELQTLVNDLKASPETKVIILTAAVVDYKCDWGDDELERPTVKVGGGISVGLTKANKIVQSIRDEDHKHIFLVAFKQTCGLSAGDMYLAGLKLCKEASVNLVFVNDTITRRNMIVTPEEAAYADGWEREEALRELVDMTVLRSHLSFTRSTVVDGKTIPWDSDHVPESLREVVNFCREEGAYKAFKGSTVGHFAVKLSPTDFLTSIRRSNFNDLDEVGLVEVTTDGPDNVYAREDARDDIQVMSQREVECGSHECGQNTANGLKQFGNLWAVMLDRHGPNIVFSKDIDPNEVIDFIKANFDLTQKTGGYNLEPVMQEV
jgi:hypothetical protein